MLPLADLDESLTIYFILGSIALFILMYFVGNTVFKSKTVSITQESSLAKKLAIYRESKLIQAVTLEASALCAMVFFMLNNHVFFVVIALISLVQMIRVFPQKAEMITTLNLSYSEQQKLNNPDALLS